MSEESILDLIGQLRNGAVNHIEIKKEDFLNFRATLIQQDDFKQFIGEAKHGGNTIYYYQKKE